MPGTVLDSVCSISQRRKPNERKFTYLQPMHTKGGLLGGWWASVVTDTHVDLPQIFLWYHCLQLVKYFLLVPMSFCTAHTLGLKTKAAVQSSRMNSGPTRLHLPAGGLQG